MSAYDIDFFPLRQAGKKPTLQISAKSQWKKAVADALENNSDIWELHTKSKYIPYKTFPTA